MSRGGKPKRRCCHWKAEEIEALKTFSREYSDQQIAILLDRTPSGVGAMRGQLGIKRMEQPAHLQKKTGIALPPATVSAADPILVANRPRDPIPGWMYSVQSRVIDGFGGDYRDAVAGLLRIARDLAEEHRCHEFVHWAMDRPRRHSWIWRR